MSTDRPSATLDVGSNTIRLLVARPAGDHLEQILDTSEFVRLGAGVDSTGRLQSEKVEAGLDAVKRLTSAARDAGADPILAVATSAVRDAANGTEFAQRVEAATGVHLDIISGEREAYLTYIGASLGLPENADVLVCDLGGGSAEFVYARSGSMQWAVSKPLGSGRLTERHITHDPPDDAERRGVVSDVERVLDTLPAASVQRLVCTGGTASHIAWLAGRTDRVIELALEDLDLVLQELAEHTADEIVRQYDIMPERARVLPAGAEAVRAIAEYYRVSDVTITRNGIREGAIIEYLQRAGRWPSASASGQT